MTTGVSARLCLAAFWFSLLCNMTLVSVLLGIDAFNSVISVAVLASMVPFFIWRRPFTVKAFITYFFPVALLLIGVLVNYVKNMAQSGVVSANIATIFPFFYALTFSYYIGTHKKLLDRVLELYVIAITLFSALAIVDISAIVVGLYAAEPYAGGSDQYAKGLFAFYGILGDGQIYPRLYGLFPEPGHYAMYLLPVLVHNVITRKPAFLAINFICFIGTLSLGGYLAFCFVVATMLAYSSSRKLRPRHFIWLVGIILSVYFLYDYFVGYYLAKGESASIREDNFLSFFINFKEMVLHYPLGYPFFESLEQMAREEKFVVGTNFSPFNIYMQGGLISLIGYISLLFISLYYALINHRNKDVCIRVFCSVVPAFILFAVQRTTPFETYYFPFLIAPFIVYFSSGSDYV